MENYNNIYDNCFKLAITPESEDALIELITAAHADNCGYILETYKECVILQMKFVSRQPDFMKCLAEVRRLSLKSWYHKYKREESRKSD